MRTTPGGLIAGTGCLLTVCTLPQLGSLLASMLGVPMQSEHQVYAMICGFLLSGGVGLLVDSKL